MRRWRWKRQWRCCRGRVNRCGAGADADPNACSNTRACSDAGARSNADTRSHANPVGFDTDTDAQPDPNSDTSTQ